MLIISCCAEPTVHFINITVNMTWDLLTCDLVTSSITGQIVLGWQYIFWQWYWFLKMWLLIPGLQPWLRRTEQKMNAQKNFLSQRLASYRTHHIRPREGSPTSRRSSLLAIFFFLICGDSSDILRSVSTRCYKDQIKRLWRRFAFSLRARA